VIESKSGAHILTFDDIKHFYSLDGSPVESVTTVIKGGSPESPQLSSWKVKEGSKYTIEQLKLCPEPAIKLPQYLLDEVISKSTQASRRTAQKAANIGSLVHEYAETIESKRSFDLSIVEQHPDRDKIESCISKFKEWKVQNEDTIINHEDIIASIANRYAGRFDRLAKRRSSIVLSDFKTSSGIYVDQFVQLAAYVIAIKEWLNIDVNAIEIVRFGKENGDFETKLVSNPGEIQEYKEQFLRNLATYKFIKKHEVPRLKRIAR